MGKDPVLDAATSHIARQKINPYRIDPLVSQFDPFVEITLVTAIAELFAQARCEIELMQQDQPFAVRAGVACPIEMGGQPIAFLVIDKVIFQDRPDLRRAGLFRITQGKIGHMGALLDVAQKIGPRIGGKGWLE